MNGGSGKPAPTNLDPFSDTAAIFKAAIAKKDVSWQLLHELAMCRQDEARDPGLRAVADRYYPQALDVFKTQHEGVEVAMFGPIGGLYVLEDGELQWTFDTTKINFDWSAAWNLVFQIEVLAEEAKDWWRAKTQPIASSSKHRLRFWIHRILDPTPGQETIERRPHTMRAFGLATWVMGAMRQEATKHPPIPADTPPRQQARSFLSSVANYRSELTVAQRRFRAAAQRTAQSRYWQGTLVGAGVLFVLCVILGGIFWWRGVEAAYGVALPAGGLGAMVSVLQRMSSGRLVLDIDAGRDLLEVFGAVRPFIGAIFGVAVMALLLGGLVPAVQVPADQKLAFFAGLGFLAGFNERWAQDMLKSSANQMGSEVEVDKSKPSEA